MKLALLATALVASAAAFAADPGVQTPTAPAIAASFPSRGTSSPIFCSDADFVGTCRTFGPGEYRRLPRGLDNRISSGRRISENYPYQGRPNWERR